jgi:hypothetical protein
LSIISGVALWSHLAVSSNFLTGIELDGLAAALRGFVDGFEHVVHAEAVGLAAGVELADFGGIGDRGREGGRGEQQGEKECLHGGGRGA